MSLDCRSFQVPTGFPVKDAELGVITSLLTLADGNLLVVIPTACVVAVPKRVLQRIHRELGCQGLLHLPTLACGLVVAPAYI